MILSVSLVLILYAVVNADDVNTNEAYRQPFYLERLAEIETILKQQTSQLERQQQEIQLLKETIEKQNHEIENLKTHRDSRKIMQSFDSNVQDSFETVSDSESMEQQGNILSDDNGNVWKDTVNPRMLAADSQAAVGFYAYLGHSEITPGPHHTVIFDVVKTNSHGGYNRNSGIFTVPVAGVYGFIFTMRMPCSNYGTFEIMKNSEVQGTIHVNTQHFCAGQMSTGAIITAVSPGDIVYIRTHLTIGTSGNILSDQYGWPYFLGWLISA